MTDKDIAPSVRLGRDQIVQALNEQRIPSGEDLHIARKVLVYGDRFSTPVRRIEKSEASQNG